MTDESDIPSLRPEHPRLPEDKLLAYLEGKLSPQEQHDVEEWLSEEGMESDAIEGLMQTPKQTTHFAINKINIKLQKTLARRKSGKKKYLRPDNLSWLAAIIILLLTIVAFIVIKMTLKK